MFPHAAWKSEMWKVAARAGLRQIGRMVQQGNVAGASALAKSPGVLKPSAAGSQIRHLGQGSEGLATLVAHPEHGVAVRKLYNPQGMSTPQMIARKEEVGRAVGANPNIAQFYGSSPTPHGGGTMHFSEFVSPQGPRPIGSPEQSAAAVEKARQGTIKAVAGTNLGYAGAVDVRKGNMQWDGNMGRYRTVDYMPARRGEFLHASPDQKSMIDMPTRTRYNLPQGGGDPRRFLMSTGRSPDLTQSSVMAEPSKLLGGMLSGRVLQHPALAVRGVRAPTHVEELRLPSGPGSLTSSSRSVAPARQDVTPTSHIKRPISRPPG